MNTVIKNWDRESRRPLWERIGIPSCRRTPLRERIAMSVYRLKTQKSRIAGSTARMQQRDKEFFSKCVAAQLAKDSARAAMYANECAEVRKMARVTLRSELALERITLRLETIEQFGDLANLMSPVVGVVQAVRNQIQGIMPQVSFELGMIGETLSSVVIEVGEAMGSDYDVSASSPDAQNILTEANTIAEQRMRENFPELPTTDQTITTPMAELTRT